MIHFRGNIRRGLANATALTLGAVLLAACGGKHESTMTSYSSAVAHSGAGLITLPANQMAHVQVVTVSQQTLPHVLRLSSLVDYNGFQTTPVISAVSGPVARILVQPGVYVRKGQVLLEASSPEFSQARDAYLKAKDSYQLAQREYLRSKDLYRHQAIAQRDLQQAESTRNQAQADLQAAEQSLRILGISNAERVSATLSPEIPVLAPISGQVVERLVAPGQLLQAGSTQCFTISNTSTVWVLANVFEKDLAQIHVGDPVTVESDAYPQTFRGRVDYIGSALDPNSHTLQARIVVNNRGGMLKKGMYVTAAIQAGRTQALAVPVAAVLHDSENEPFVYLEVKPNQFGRRSVTTGDSQNGLTAILSGLHPGDRVVGNGSLFLQFASQIQQ